MIVTEEMLDELVKHRLAKVAEQKKPIFRPRLKVHKLFGEKRQASIHLDIPISRETIIKDVIDWNLEDHVDVEAFARDYCSKLGLEGHLKSRIETELTFQLIDHIERATLRTRMTKEQKMLSNKLKQEEKEREMQLAEENKPNRRKLLGRGAELGVARKKCPYCFMVNLRSDITCKGCKLPLKIFKEEETEVDKFKAYTLGLLARLSNNSDFLKTLNILQKLEPHDVTSIGTFWKKVSSEIFNREDFDPESKEELVKIFEGYIYKYITMAVFYSKDYPFLENENDVSKEKIKVVSEKRARPGRPRRDETVMKILSKNGTSADENGAENARPGEETNPGAINQSEGQNGETRPFRLGQSTVTIRNLVEPSDKPESVEKLDWHKDLAAEAQAGLLQEMMSLRAKHGEPEHSTANMEALQKENVKSGREMYQTQFNSVFSGQRGTGGGQSQGEGNGQSSRHETAAPEQYMVLKKRKRGRPRKVVRFRPVTGDRSIVYEEEAEEEIIDGRMMLGKRTMMQGEDKEYQDQEEEGEAEEPEE